MRGIAATPEGDGYWLAAADGGVFCFGAAGFWGAATGPHAALVGITGSGTGEGYWVARADGSVVAFGDAVVLGAVTDADAPLVAIVA
jgi:hypothetical protein